MDFVVKKIASLRAVSCYSVLLISAPVFSASLDSPADVTNAASAMYTIEDLYNRLDNGTTGTPRTTTFTEPTSGPSIGAGDHDLNDVMGKAPVVDDTNGASASDVLTGKKFWGLKSGAWGLQTGTHSTLYPAVVPKTGQNTCYTVGGLAETPPSCTLPGQDGEFLKGIAHASPRFTVPGDGTIIDNSTGLIWLTNAGCGGATRTWSQALNDITSLNTTGTMNAGGCGDTSNSGTFQTDWRLPNVRELQSLTDFQNGNPSLPTGHPFSNVVSERYWSSTSHVGVSTQAWTVDMEYGNTWAEIKTTQHRVWPVRGGQ